MTRLENAAPHEIAALLRGPGLALDLGSATLVVRSDEPALVRDLALAYRHHPLLPAPDFADIHLDLRRHGGWRRPWRAGRPQVRLFCDGEEPFLAFPATSALPMMEWGTNWLIGQRSNHLLLFHAGCLERDGLALLLPATPGSGKSTLTAALSHSGWRLLSDEFGVCDPSTGRMQAMLKPIALKNESVGVIRERFPAAAIGPLFRGTRKGDVAHVAAPPPAVAERHRPAAPAAVLLPQWKAGSPTLLEPIAEDEVFRALAFNCFNYAVLGEDAFRTALAITRASVGWRLTYSDLGDAIVRLQAWWQETVRPRQRSVAPEQAT